MLIRGGANIVFEGCIVVRVRSRARNGTRVIRILLPVLQQADPADDLGIFNPATGNAGSTLIFVRQQIYQIIQR
ncbi:hypothetical protein D3C74_329190 [compost metagenome]